ncbi:hypothetical protein M514_09513 [Trichuris suis]|uniref:DUF5641 domain-containing protein n=1 Tax=Trichuris suis TaxID=68888 RepID=A0A085MQL4_9BILA|nr:hypothetical protein M513_09513 [Trichuris suis]KFD59510.1 hypothetical protein M514_09513 [Trichuris suis]
MTLKGSGAGASDGDTKRRLWPIFGTDGKENTSKKWRTVETPPRVGDLVLIEEENVPRSRWRMGLIEELFPSKDGLCRTARVKSAKGFLTRPTAKLYLLEPAAES